MNRLDEIFNSGKKNLLNIYCTAGYPHIDSLSAVMLALQAHGADMIEVGIPYTDPVADGPVIQHSNTVALQNGMSVQLLLQQLKNIKQQLSVPVILMGYFNPVLQYGIEKFCTEANEAGVQGVILPDLPVYEYEKQYKAIFKKHRLHVIFLVSPGTSEKRIRLADRASSGFLYAISSSSTTGNMLSPAAPDEYLEKLQRMQLDNPVMIGFGIRDKHSFQQACRYAHGAIIGSAYIQMLGQATNIDVGTKAFISNIKE